MENTGYIALSRQTALWRRLDAVANNIANLNTTGYRGQDVLFSDYLTRVPNTDSATRDQVRFTRDFGSVYDLSVGHLKETGQSMDLALEDPNQFLVLETPGGERYSRGGSFMLDQDGMIVSREGHAVISESGAPLFIAPNESQITILKNGSVSTENGPVGALKVVTFDNPQALRRSGDVLWIPRDDQQAAPAQTPRVAQGMLEASNVNGVVEMTKMIQVQRAYQAAGQMIQAEDERIKKAIRAWGRVT